MGQDQFKHHTITDAELLAEYLEVLKEGFKSGALTMSVENKVFTLKPAGLIAMEIESRRREGQVKLNLKFSWSEGERTSPLAKGQLKLAPFIENEPKSTNKNNHGNEK